MAFIMATGSCVRECAVQFGCTLALETTASGAQEKLSTEVNHKNMKTTFILHIGQLFSNFGSPSVRLLCVRMCVCVPHMLVRGVGCNRQHSLGQHFSSATKWKSTENASNDVCLQLFGKACYVLSHLRLVLVYFFRLILIIADRILEIFLK